MESKKNTFNSIHIDLDSDVYEINKKSVKGNQIKELHLSFVDGMWTLNYTKELLSENKKGS